MVPLIAALGSVGLMLLVVLIVSLGSGEPASGRPENQHTRNMSAPEHETAPSAKQAAAIPGGSDYKRAVRAWIDENADDPDVEEVKWEGPRQKHGRLIVRLKYRMPRGQLGTVLVDQFFELSGGEAELVTHPAILASLSYSWNREGENPQTPIGKFLEDAREYRNRPENQPPPDQL